jgi:hypothetical protein
VSRRRASRALPYRQTDVPKNWHANALSTRRPDWGRAESRLSDHGRGPVSAFVASSAPQYQLVPPPGLTLVARQISLARNQSLDTNG